MRNHRIFKHEDLVKSINKMQYTMDNMLNDLRLKIYYLLKYYAKNGTDLSHIQRLCSKISMTCDCINYDIKEYDDD